MTDKTDALMAQLDDYLRGCPDPNKVWPKWMVKKASRLLWACREVLAALRASLPEPGVVSDEAVEAALNGFFQEGPVTPRT